MASDQVSLDSLGPEELAHVRQQLETEVNSLLQNAVALQQTATMFAAAGQAVENLQKQEPGKSMLIPLTESLYVSGVLESVETVLLEIGTGYYVERSTGAGIDFCRRKVMLVRDQTEQLSKLVQSRQAALQQVNGLLEYQQQQAAAA